MCNERLRLVDPEAACIPGTGLGDPIEVGAAVSVYSDRKLADPTFTLTSSKSQRGHAEPGAGVYGIMHAVLALSNMAALPIMHLHTLNPMVAGALDLGSSARWCLSRQLGASPSANAGGSKLSGVSAFAFQGTNAHVIVAAPTPASGHQVKPMNQTEVWKRERYWIMPEAKALVNRCLVAGAGGMTFEVNLNMSKLSFIWDHQVQNRLALNLLLLYMPCG